MARYKKEKLLKALEIIEHAKKEIRVEACKDSFGLFFVYYYAKYVKYPFAPFHFEMMEQVEKLNDGEYKELVWMMFRESAKTSIAKAYVVWCIVYEKKRYINYDSYDKGNAESALFDIITELTTNKALIRDFGALYERQTQQTSAGSPQLKRITNFVTNNGVKVEAFSTQESPRGRIYGAYRPDLIIMDDFENSKTKESDIVTLKVIEHINEFKKALDSADGKILYLCNYISDNGSVNHLLNRSKDNPSMHVLNVPVMTDYELDGLKIIKGKATWDAKYDVHTKKSRKKLPYVKISLSQMLVEDTSAVFYPEMLNHPRNEADREFKEEWFKYETFANVLKLDTRRFITIDPRGKDSDKKGTDYIGVCINYVDDQGNWYIKAFKRKWNTTELVNQLFIMQSTVFAEVIGIEGTAFTEGMKPYLEGEQNKRGVMLPIQELKHGGINKHTRIRGLIPYYEKGKIYHIRDNVDDNKLGINSNTCKDLEDELARFPKTTRDDTMDGTQYQLHIAEAPVSNIEQDWGLYEMSFT